MFKCASGPKLSEIDIATGWGSPESAKALLERHWDTFITEDDFFYLASIGINTVRLPVGFWHLGPQFCADTVFSDVGHVYENAWNRILHAINMAADAGVGVLIDLHGAVGSQNGCVPHSHFLTNVHNAFSQPHSGISDGMTGLFRSEANIVKTLSALTFVLQRLGHVTNIVGIQILNEPVYDPTLTAFCMCPLESLCSKLTHKVRRSRYRSHAPNQSRHAPISSQWFRLQSIQRTNVDS